MAFDTTYDVFLAWKKECLDKDGSFLFDGKELWTKKNLQIVFNTMRDNPLEGEGTFIDKIKEQFADYDEEHDVWLLLVEILALHYSPFTKVDKAKKTIELCEGEEFSDSFFSDLQKKAQALKDTEGFVRAGFHFFKSVYIGIIYYSGFALKYKEPDSALPSLVGKLLSGDDPCWSQADEFKSRNIIDATTPKSHYPRVVRSMFGRKYYNDIYSGTNVSDIIKAFSEECSIPEDITRDEKIYRIGEALLKKEPKLAKRPHNGLIDFYTDPLKSRWPKKGVREEPNNGYDSRKTNEEDPPMNDNPLNRILYGPPGTGKTYNTVNHALAILEQKRLDAIDKEDRNALRKRYEQYREEGRIEMITFHQNFVYEEFVEGIKPILDNNSDTLRYELDNGVFKRLAERAGDAQQAPSRKVDVSTLLESYAEDVQRRLDAGETVYLRPDQKTGPTLRKVNRDKEGNFRSFLLGGSIQCETSVARNTVKRYYENFCTGEIKTYQDIKTSRKSKISHHGNAIYYFSLFERMKEFQEAQENLGTDYGSHQSVGEPERYVLIIDEINRGNIAKIFGELITLLEKDKRAGADEEVIVTLPYSGDDFSVPSNLYIVGTMNTADRSIALLDTALRRRFSFIEMMPNPELLQGKVVDGVHLKELLEQINLRIRKELDREHQIGHSYFMSVKALDDLKNTFQTKVIPLLQEYFYDDWGKIVEVLNNNGLIVGDKSGHENLREVLAFDDPKWDDPKSYLKIVETFSAGDDE